jgi:hypothetical protein
MTFFPVMTVSMDDWPLQKPPYKTSPHHGKQPALVRKVITDTDEIITDTDEVITDTDEVITDTDEVITDQPSSWQTTPPHAPRRA